jgi:flagellar protein FlbD
VITLTRLNGQHLAVNPDLIKFIERSPDTVITMTSGDKLVVRELPEEVSARIVRYRHAILQGDFGGVRAASREPHGPGASAHGDDFNG